MRLPSRPGTLDPAADARLVERCLAGDTRAWEALVQRHERLVYAVARAYRLGDDDLGDVFQEVFAALVKGLPRLRDPRSLVRWLSSTTDRIARAAAFRQRRERALSTSHPVTLEKLDSGAPAIGADLERLEGEALVRLAFAGLGGRCRELLSALYYRDDPPSYADLARALGIPLGSLGPTRARCLKRLRELLAGLAGDPGIKPGDAPTSDATPGSAPEVRRPAERTRHVHPPVPEGAR